MKIHRVVTNALLLCLLSSIGGSLSAQDAPRVIEVHAKRFAFVPSEITLKQGETAQIVLTSDDVPHSLVVKELNFTDEASKGHPGTATIVAAKSGDFRGACGRFCGSGHGSMVFMVHVH